MNKSARSVIWETNTCKLVIATPRNLVSVAHSEGLDVPILQEHFGGITLSKLFQKKKKFTQRGGKSRMRDGLTHASMIASSLHLYTKDDGRLSTGRMANAPCLEVLPLHCH